jgi:hypothetical protein
MIRQHRAGARLRWLAGSARTLGETHGRGSVLPHRDHGRRAYLVVRVALAATALPGVSGTREKQAGQTAGVSLRGAREAVT